MVVINLDMFLLVLDSATFTSIQNLISNCGKTLISCQMGRKQISRMQIQITWRTKVKSS